MDDNIVRTFYSDASHNYMVIECPHELRDNYQYKMLAANQIRGLLPCSSRSIDNQEYLYYDITSRQSMEDLYDRRPVRGADIEKLLEDLLRVEKTLTEYLLDASHMILDPSFIYMDFRENESSFVYYPGVIREAGWDVLFSFLADRVDGKDKRAAALVYRLCMMAEKPGFRLKEETLEEMGVSIGKKKRGAGSGSIYDAREFGERSACSSGRLGNIDPGDDLERYRGSRGRKKYEPGLSLGYPPERGETEGANAEFPLCGMEETDGAFFGAPGGGTADRFAERYGFAAKGGEDSTVFQAERSRGALWKNIFLYLLSVLIAAGGAGLILLHRMIPLGEKETVLSLAAGVLLALAGAVFAIVRIIRGIRGENRACTAAGRTPESRHISAGRIPERGYIDAGENSEGGYTGSREEGFGFEEWMYGNGEARDPWMDFDGQEGQTDFSDRKKKMDAGRGSLVIAGETSVLGPDTGKSLALYGTGTCRGEKISLEDLPCVVGKMQSYVDQVLDDSSVSRMHARFSTDHDGKMTVRDLNSTNGTWLNGERLTPNECRVMRQGDHVRLGCMEFVFR